MEEFDDTDYVLDTSSAQSEFSELSFKSRMMAIRMKNPYLSIAALPNKCIALLLDPMVAREVFVPDGVVYVKFSSDGNFGIRRGGQASWPVSTSDPKVSIFTQNDDDGIIINPVREYYYVNDVQSMSFISQFGCVVSMLCYTQE